MVIEFPTADPSTRTPLRPTPPAAAPSLREAPSNLAEVAPDARELARFLMRDRFAIDGITTKLEILRDEFTWTHDCNPIEHLESRVKSPDGIFDKAIRRGCAFDLDAIAAEVRDIAGVRVVCSFEADVYSVFDILRRQSDITVVEVEDYIAHPKPNGYRSLHAIITTPVFLSTGPELVDVELQLRTVAMDFWATLEHKIHYKYDRQVPATLLAELSGAAETAAHLDERMQRLHLQIRADRKSPTLPPVG